MAHASPGRVLRAVLALFAFALVPGATPAAEPSAYEVGVSTREAGHLRGLLEKLSKENALYQLHFGGVTKQHMQETSAEIDRVIDTLEKGSPAYSVAPPVTRGIEEQLRALDAKWGSVRRMALASPYDYLRFQSDLMPKRSRMGDPLLLRAFDQLAAAVMVEAETLMGLYKVECDALEGEFCAAATQSGYFNMRVERIAKELALVYAGLEVSASLEHMRRDRDELEASLAALAKSPILTQAADPSRGKPAEFVKRLWDSVEGGWEKLRFEVDLALQGHADGLDMRRMLRVQSDLVDDLDRLRAALSRYAQVVNEG